MTDATTPPTTSSAWTPDALVYDLTSAGDPQISPDGRQVVFSRTRINRESDKGETDLFLIPIDGGEPRRLTYGGTRNGSPRWSPDGATIAFVSDRGGGPTDAASTLLLLPVDGGEARPLTGHHTPIQAPAWSPDGSRIAYSTLVDPVNPDGEPRAMGAPEPVRVATRLDYKQDNRGFLGDTRQQVCIVDVATGERHQLTTDTWDHLEPQWSPDGKQLAVRIPGENTFTSQIGLVDAESGEITRIGAAGGNVAVWSWSPDGRWIVYAGDDTVTWQADMFRYDVASGEVARLTNDLPCQPDAGFPTIAPPAQPVWLDERTILMHALRAGASGLYAFDVESAELTLVRSWQATHAGLSVDRDCRYVIQALASLETTGEITVFDRETGESRPLTSGNADVLASHPPARWERFDVTRGDVTTEAWLLFPPDFDPGRRYPVILDVHGGPHGHYGYAFNATQQLLASNGFLVVYSNPRGSGTYGREFTQRVIRDWGGEDYQDLLAVLDAVLARPYADPERTGIYGYSYGGYMTAWAIGQSDRFAAAVCGAPCFDLESMWGTSDIGHSFGENEWGGMPQVEAEWYRAHSPSEFAHRVTTPTLIVHGEADERCPIGQGEQMFISLKRAGCEVVFARYPGGSHAMTRTGPPAHRVDYLSRVLGWFRDHLAVTDDAALR